VQLQNVADTNANHLEITRMNNAATIKAAGMHAGAAGRSQITQLANDRAARESRPVTDRDYEWASEQLKPQTMRDAAQLGIAEIARANRHETPTPEDIKQYYDYVHGQGPAQRREAAAAADQTRRAALLEKTREDVNKWFSAGGPGAVGYIGASEARQKQLYDAKMQEVWDQNNRFLGGQAGGASAVPNVADK
jgi:hypothetical protein